MENQKKTLTASNIKYLLAMYQLCSENNGTKCARIADLLQISKPSVHTMMNTLKDMRLVKKSPYGGVFFTDEGLQLAERYDQYYQGVSNLFKIYLLDESDIRCASYAMLAEVSDEGLACLCNKQQIDGGEKENVSDNLKN